MLSLKVNYKVSLLCAIMQTLTLQQYLQGRVGTDVGASIYKRKGRKTKHTAAQ